MNTWIRLMPVFLLALLVLIKASPLSAAWLINSNYPAVVRAEQSGRTTGSDQCGPALLPHSVIADLNDAVALNSVSVAGWIALARAKWLGRDCQGSLMAWRHAVALAASRNLTADIGLGWALYWEGQLADAVATFQAVRAGSYLLAWGNSARQTGDLMVAEKLYYLALAVEPDPAVADQLSNLFVESNDLASAVAVWRTLAAASDPDRAAHWVALAEADRLEKNWPAARDDYLKAANRSPDSYDIYLRLARMLSGAGLWTDVGSVSERAVQLRPGASSEPYTLAAAAELELGHFTAALKWCERGASQLPSDPWLDFEVGLIFERQGNDVEAEARYQAALAKSPDNFTVALQISLLEYRKGNVPLAIKYLSPFAAGANCNVLINLSKWNSEIGRPEQASVYQKQLLQHCVGS